MLSRAAEAKTIRHVAPGWVLEQWGRADGLPIEHIRDLALDREGVLWLATYDGLVRFDGLDFQTLRSSHPQGPPRNRVEGIAVHPGDGALWLRTGDGLLQRRTPAGQQSFPDNDYLLLSPDSETLWANGAGGVYRLDAAPELVVPADDIRLLGSDPTGGLWLVQGDHAVLRWQDGVLTPQAVPPLPWAPVVRRDRAGQPMLLAHPDGPALVWDSAAHQLTTQPQAPAERAVSSLPRPSRWGVLGDHTVVLDDRALVTLSARIWRVLEDGDQLWLATEGDGLARLRPAPLRTHGAASSGAGNVVRVWWDSGDNVLWGLFAGDGWQSIWPAGVALDLPASLWADELTERFSVLHRGAGGERWFGHGDRLFREEGGDWQPVDIPPLEMVAGLWSGPDGLWISARESVARPTDGGWATLSGPDGLAPLWARDWLAAPGGVLLAGLERLWWVPDGETVAAPLLPSLSPTRHIRPGGARLWLSTERDGLCAAQLEGAALTIQRCLNEASGLGRATIHASLADGQGRVWMSSNQGIGVASAALLDAFAAGEQDSVSVRWLDERDGMANAEGNNFLGDGVATTPDGRLWFATQAGVVEAAPQALAAPGPPAVHLLSVSVGAALHTAGPLVLEPAHAPVRLRWTTAAQPHAEQVSFRYRLTEAQGWSAPSTQRTLELTALPPGQHQLEIQARLGGDWGAGTVLSITRQPALHERSVFGLLLALGAAAAGLGAMLLWSRLQRQRNQQLQRQVSDQTRQLSDQNNQLSKQNARLAHQADALADRNRELGLRTEALRSQSRQMAAQAEQLQAVDRLKRQLIANVSHELRTPLSLIIAPLSALQQTLTGDSAARDVGLALQSAERLQVLIGQLFDLSRAQAGGLQLRARAIDAAGFLRALVERFGPQARAGGHTLRLQTTLSQHTLWCDPDLLDKVVSNLLSNALRHSPPAAAITITLTASDAHAEISVEDEGPGVPAAHREQIFGRFYQIDGGADRQRDGAGLGLALVRELTELHGGEVGVTDGAIGARFWVRLPLGVSHLAPDDIALDAPTPLAHPPEPAPVATDGARPRVLLLEDHSDMRAYLVENLRPHFSVTAAADGHAGLALAERHPFALVISDVMMPGMDGLTFVQRFRTLPGRARVPVMFLSARQELSDRLEGLELADDYLAKPFLVPELIARARALLRRTGPRPGTDTPAPEPVAGPHAAPANALLVQLEAAASSRLSEPNFRVAELAKQLGMSARTLQQRMQDNDLPAPGAWLRALRIERAAAMLSSGEHATVGEIAAAVGMSPSYFSRAYRAHTGHPPREDHRPPAEG